MLEAIAKEPIEETPTMQRLRQFNPEEYKEHMAYVKKLRKMADE